MDNTTKKPKNVTLADVNATFDRVAALSEKNEKKLDRLEESIAATGRELDRMAKEREISMAELKESIAATGRELDRVIKEREIADKKRDEEIAELRKLNKSMNSEVKGIANSNGLFAEEYFYRTLDESRTFGGYHFDFADRNLKRNHTNKEGKPVQTEYDVLMGNKVATCILEVKYRARKKNIEELLEKVDKFRIHFPAYANHKIFLGIGALSFEEGVERMAKEYGIGIMRQNGDAVEIDDANLKAY